MPLQKEYTKLTPRILEHVIQRWGKQLNRQGKWNDSDSKVYLFLNIVLKDLYRERYLNRKAKLCQK